jgi:hypothetical protein
VPFDSIANLSDGNQYLIFSRFRLALQLDLGQNQSLRLQPVFYIATVAAPPALVEFVGFFKNALAYFIAA